MHLFISNRSDKTRCVGGKVGECCISLLILLSGAVSCRPPAPQVMEPRAEAKGSEIHLALGLVEKWYLFPTRVDPPRMLDAALRELAAAVPGFKTGQSADKLGWVLRLGDNTSRIDRSQVADMESLAGMLESTLAFIQRYSRERLDPTTLRVTALSGAIGTLDRYSKALDANALAMRRSRLRGDYVGIGARVGRREGKIVFLQLFEGGSASEAGIKPGDQLVAVDGQEVGELSVAEVVGLLRGPDGSTVAFQIAGNRGGPPREVVLERRRVAVPTTTITTDSTGVWIVEVRHMTRQTPVEIRNALIRARREGTLPPGILLDLRGNTGGSTLGAARIADIFLKQGLMLQLLGRDHKPVPHLVPAVHASAAPSDFAGPLGALVDSRTGSSAEALTAILQRRRRAVIVGHSTYGKGVVQKLYAVGKVLGLKLTVARYVVEGEPLPAEGLKPDVNLAANSGAGEMVAQEDTGDPELRAAIRALLKPISRPRVQRSLMGA